MNGMKVALATSERARLAAGGSCFHAPPAPARPPACMLAWFNSHSLPCCLHSSPLSRCCCLGLCDAASGRTTTHLHPDILIRLSLLSPTFVSRIAVNHRLLSFYRHPEQYVYKRQQDLEIRSHTSRRHVSTRVHSSSVGSRPAAHHPGRLR